MHDYHFNHSIKIVLSYFHVNTKIITEITHTRTRAQFCGDDVVLCTFIIHNDTGSLEVCHRFVVTHLERD